MGRRWRRFPRPRPHPEPLGRRLSGRSRPDVDARSVAQRIAENVERVIIGKRGQVELAVMTLMCGGHLLVEDVPGGGKTMLARRFRSLRDVDLLAQAYGRSRFGRRDALESEERQRLARAWAKLRGTLAWQAVRRPGGRGGRAPPTPSVFSDRSRAGHGP